MFKKGQFVTWVRHTGLTTVSEPAKVIDSTPDGKKYQIVVYAPYSSYWVLARDLRPECPSGLSARANSGL